MHSVSQKTLDLIDSKRSKEMNVLFGGNNGMWNYQSGLHLGSVHCPRWTKAIWLVGRLGLKQLANGWPRLG